MDAGLTVFVGCNAAFVGAVFTVVGSFFAAGLFGGLFLGAESRGQGESKTGNGEGGQEFHKILVLQWLLDGFLPSIFKSEGELVKKFTNSTCLLFGACLGCRREAFPNLAEPYEKHYRLRL